MEHEDALFVTQYYRPELVGSGPFCGEIAEWLALSRSDVAVLTGMPNYPDGEVFAGYRDAAIARESIDGVVVERVKTWLPKRRSVFGRVAAELWFFAQGWRAVASGRIKRRRLTLSLCPSILTVLLGSVARHHAGRHVAVIHDVQSGLAHGLGMVRVSWLLTLMRFCERRILNRVDLILVLTEEMKTCLRQMGVTARIEVMPIWADTDRIQPVPGGAGQRVGLVYSGSFGRKQNVAQILSLAVDLADRAPDIDILLRGRGKEFAAVRSVAQAQGLQNIRFADLVPADKMFDGMSSADIHLVMHDPSAANFAVPSKLYNILAAGLPCVAQARSQSALGHLNRESGGFLCVPSEGARPLADAILELARDEDRRLRLGREGRRYIEERCSRQIVLSDLSALLDRLGRERVTAERRGVLIFEPEAEGHSLEWLRHLLRYACRSGRSDKIVWIVAPAVLIEALSEDIRGIQGDQVRLLALKPHEASLCCHRSLTASSFARWWIARRYLRQTRAGSIHFLALDLLSLPLALGFGFNRPVSGILFRPSTHYRFLGPYNPNWRERLRDLRKTTLYRLMLSRRSLATVLSLDPYFAQFALQTYRHGSKIRSLPDPADEPQESSIAARRLVAAIPTDRVVFLLFGYLTERKGTLKLLEALHLLPREIASQVAVLLVGKVAPSISNAVHRQSLSLSTTRPEIFCHVEDRRVTTEEIEAAVRRADVVLAPYQRFVGSSGVMLWAARCGKPILTQDFGVLNSFMRDYRLGLTVDCTKSFLLAEAIAQFVRRGPKSFIDLQAAREFMAGRSPGQFAEIVLTNVA